MRDEARNTLIFDDVLAALEAKRSPLVITERTEHLFLLAERFKKFAKNVIVLKGGQIERERRNVTERFITISDEDERLLLATGRYLGEGFDDARLDTLFLTTPISWKGALAQYAGRLHRLHDAKRDVVIFDYVDREVSVFARMAARRRAGYAALGYVVDGKSDADKVTAVSGHELWTTHSQASFRL